MATSCGPGSRRSIVVRPSSYRAADAGLTPDPRRRLPGRGAWVHPVPECLTRAERRSAFPRALRVPGPLDVDRVRSSLKAGAATPGPVRYDSSTTRA